MSKTNSNPVQAKAPSAMRKAPERGADYWRLTPTGGWLHTWMGSEEDYGYLRNGLAFSTREALANAQTGAA